MNALHHGRSPPRHPGAPLRAGSIQGRPSTLYLQDVRGYSALKAGLLTIPMAVMLAVFAQLSGRLVASRGPRLPLVLAGPALTAGALRAADERRTAKNQDPHGRQHYRAVKPCEGVRQICR